MQRNENKQDGAMETGLAVEAGHEWIYRLTALRDGSALETRYFKDPHETQGPAGTTAGACKDGCHGYT